MKPTEWNSTMAGAGSYPVVAREVRAYLADCKGQISTTDLINALYAPQHGDTDEGMKARRKLFAAVQHLAGGDLADCASRGPEKKVMGRVGRAWLWHASNGKASADELAEALAEANLTIADREGEHKATVALLVALDELLLGGAGEPVMSDDMDPAAWDAFVSAWATATKQVYG